MSASTPQFGYITASNPEDPPIPVVVTAFDGDTIMAHEVNPQTKEAAVPERRWYRTPSNKFTPATGKRIHASDTKN